MRDSLAVTPLKGRFGFAGAIAHIAALILVAAAVLKLWAAMGPGESVWLTRHQRTWNVLVAGGEILLAGWLLSRVLALASWIAAIAAFLAFTGYSAAQLADGASSCGCLGRLEVDPRWMLGVDLALVSVLLWAGPQAERRRP
jgi:hypothetical protein